ncbi:hypothetical protein C8039_01420 [Halogeometricum sp. wsp3]|nr:hypothetical protein C8039_01420 [Halogeometricum sp. wsp3]
MERSAGERTDSSGSVTSESEDVGTHTPVANGDSRSRSLVTVFRTGYADSGFSRRPSSPDTDLPPATTE